MPGCAIRMGLPVLLTALVAAAFPLNAQGRQGAPPSARAAAGLDLTGTWVSVVTEDWLSRMVTPPKGDYPATREHLGRRWSSVPTTPEAAKIADSWDPAKDEAAGEQCRSYGAPALMRVPGLIRINWENDNTLKIETEAGTQTRLFHFSAPPRMGAPSWQGASVAQWTYAGRSGRASAGAPRRGHLKVVTTNLRPGYLRKNGVPYSANAVLTEHYNRLDEPNGDVWLIVTTMVDDPRYLTSRFATSTHFKKLPATDSRWTPEPCSAR